MIAIMIVICKAIAIMLENPSTIGMDVLQDVIIQ